MSADGGPGETLQSGCSPSGGGRARQSGSQDQPRGPSSRFYSNKCSVNELDGPCDSDNDDKNESLRNSLHVVMSAKRQRTFYAAVSAKHCSMMAPNDVLVLGVYLRSECSVSDIQMPTTDG